MARALIVDDNATNRKLLEAFCQAFGLVTDSVQSGAQALEYFAARDRRSDEEGGADGSGDSTAEPDAEYGIVLMDIHMPEMDGVETARRIMATARKAVPIVAVTADTTDENRTRCIEAGLAEVVYKPISAHVLAPVLCRYLAF